jgi:hypothetical protein
MAGPAPAKLRTDTREAVAFMVGKKGKDVGDKDKLVSKLGFTQLQLRALAAPFTAIAREHNSQALVRQTQCLELDTVGAAITLVSKTAGFDGTATGGK